MDRQAAALKALSMVPVATTQQIGSLYDNLSPSKRASETLSILRKEKLVESQRMGNMQKIWRLSKKGRELMESKRTPIPLNSLKIPHYLAISDVYFALRPDVFDYELRETFMYAGKELKYSPDCFLVKDKKAYVCEVQLKSLSRKEWSAKWERVNLYYNGGHFEKASFQRFKRIILPQFVAISRQSPDVVREGFRVQGRELIISKESDFLGE